MMSLRRNNFRKQYCRGQAMVEFIIIFMVMIMLVFGIFQFSLIYKAKITLNYAAFEAVRAGTVNNARLAAVNQAFARGMAPLYTHRDTVEAVHTARKQVNDEIEAGDQVCIERINPVKQDFTEHQIANTYFPDPDLTEAFAIPVDNLYYRSDKTTSGPGGGSGRVSIQDATLLKIKITYCYPLYVPFLNRVIPEWFTGTDDVTRFTGDATAQAHDVGFGDFKEACINNRQLPITASAVMRMQSPVIDDPGYALTCD